MGVRAETATGNEVFRGNAVVFGGTVWDFYGSLVPPENSTGELRRWAASIVPTYPSVVLHCLVDAQVIPADTPPIVMLADNPDALDEKEITLYMFSLADPSICPEGTHTVMAIGPSMREWPSPEDAGYPGKSYLEAKREENGANSEHPGATLSRFFQGAPVQHPGHPDNPSALCGKMGWSRGGAEAIHGPGTFKPAARVDHVGECVHVRGIHSHGNRQPGGYYLRDQRRQHGAPEA